MSNYLSKRFFSLALLVPLLSSPVIAYAEQQEITAEQQQALQEIETRWVQLQPEIITSIQEASVSSHAALQELLTYAADMVAPYDIALAAVDAALEYHTKNSMQSCAEVMRNYKQALMAGTVVIPQEQEDMYITRGLRERCFSSIRTRLLRANRVCALELGANNATFNNLTVSGNQTITGNLTVNGTINGGNNGPIDPSDLCTNGVLNLPCDLNVGGNQTVNNITINNNATVGGSQTINGNLTVNGTITPGGLDLTNVCSGGSVTLPCSLIVTGDETVTGNLTVNGTITGTINPASLCTAGSLTLPCDLNVTGATTLTGLLTVNNNTIINGSETINGNLTVTGTITGAIDPANLCTAGVAIFPCNLQFNSANNTLNSIGNSVEPVLNLIRGTIAPNLTATVTLDPLGASIGSAPTIVAGDGFTVSAGPTIDILGVITVGALLGTIDVLFDEAYTSRPSITLGVEDTSPGSLAQFLDYRITNVTTTGFSIEVVSLISLEITDPLPLLAGNINFMAIGPTIGG